MRGNRTWAEDVRSVKRICEGCGFKSPEDVVAGAEAFAAWAEGQKAAGLAGRTINKHAGKMSVFLRHLKSPRNWAREFERFSIEDSGDGSRPLLPAEFDRLLHAARKEPGFRDLLQLSRGTGMRPAELRKLEPGSFRTGPARIELKRRGTKTKRVRVIPLSAETAAAIERLGLPLLREGGPLFGRWPAEGRLRTLAKRAKLERVEEIGWYSLRKLYAYERWKDGVGLDDISRLMGNSPGLVEKHYLWLESMDIAERVVGANGRLIHREENVNLQDGFASCKVPHVQIAGRETHAHDSSDHSIPRLSAASPRSEQSSGGFESPGPNGRVGKAGESARETVYDPRRLRSSAVERRFCKATDSFWVGLASEILTVLLERLASLEGLDDAAAERPPRDAI